MSTKQELLSELESLVQSAVEQTEWHARTNEYLYKALAGVYLWWRRAREVEGFLEEQYGLHGILTRNYGGEEKFTQVLRLVWRLDWHGPSKANLQQWSLALREVNKEYERNTAAYKTNAQETIAQYIDAKGGVRALIGAVVYFDSAQSEIDKKSKGAKNARPTEDDTKKREKHLELGEAYFASPMSSILSIEVPKAIAVNRMGYAIALLRQTGDKTFDVLSSINDESQIAEAIISSYKRNDCAAPTVLRLLTEVVCTQSLPVALEKHRFRLADIVVRTGEKWPVRQNKRLMFRKKEGDILFSENKTDCSVVTVAKLLSSPINANEDVFLNVNDRCYIEQAIIQKHELSFYSTADDYKIPMTRSGIDASHKLVVENKVTGKLKGLFFYKVSKLREQSLPQANLASDYCSAPIWQAKVNRLWIESLNVQFVGGWLREYGDHITRAKHKVMQFDFGKTGMVIKHYGENANFTNASPLFSIKGVVKASKPISTMFAAKDILPVLDGLMQIETDGDITLSVTDDVLVIAYLTKLASYTISVPTCSKDAKRNKVAFAAYGG
jgi:hypothetical protein